MKMTTRSCLPRRLSESVVASVVARYQSIDRDAVWQGDQRWGWLVAVGVSHAFNAACEELIIRNGTESDGARRNRRVRFELLLEAHSRSKYHNVCRCHGFCG